MSRRQLNNAFVAGGVYYPPRGRTQTKAQNVNANVNVKTDTPVVEPQMAAEPLPRVTPVPAVQSPIAQEPDVNEAEAEQMNTEGDDVKDVSNGKFSFKKIFLNRKKSSVRQKEKKIRQNRQLRKALLPKNALMALNEVRGITISDFIINNNPNGGFTAVVTVNNNQYEGRGNTKMFAKNSACEKALRNYVIEKMRQKPRLPRASANNGQAQNDDQTMDGSDNNDSNCGDADSAGEEGDDVPMINLASFAIFKLFTEWENEGFVIPELHPASNPAKNGDEAAPKEPKPTPTRSELPASWEALHPCTLLCMMRPGLSYIDNGPLGEKPNVMQTVTVTTDDEQFYGQGRSKKIARRNAAVCVCNKLFGTNFVQQEC